MRIVLASKSPRRREILENLNVSFEIITADTDESSDITDGKALAEELSFRKAYAVWQTLNSTKDTLVIGCDTIVCCDGKILGKPKNREDAVRMLKSLSGKKHSVISGLTLLYGDKKYICSETTYVLFDDMTDEQINNYVSSGECDDKAGAYAIQGGAARYINGIEGCYFNVVGLPVNRLCTAAAELGILL